MSDSILSIVKSRKFTGKTYVKPAIKNEYKEYTFHYAAADPGAGKTTWGVQELVQKYFKLNKSILFVVPTIDLANEIAASSKGNIIALHSALSLERTVLSNIVSLIKASYEEKENIALVIAEASYVNATYLFSLLEYILKDWILIKDEPRDPLSIVSMRAGTDAKKIIDKFICKFEDKSRLIKAPKPISNNIKVKIEDIDQKNIRDFLNELGDITSKQIEDAFNLSIDDIDCDIFGKLAVFKNCINNPFYEVLVDKELYDKELSYDKEDNFKYSVFQMPGAYGMFGQCIFMKANFTDSFIYHQWRVRGVTWKEVDKKFNKMPTNRVNIHYCFKDDNIMWSKKYRSKENGANFKTYLNWIREELPHGDYVYVANNEYSDRDLRLSGKRMPAECHGLNAYRSYTNVALIGSYLTNSSDEPFYHYYNSSTTDSFAMRQTQYHIQQITRTDIRNYDGTAEINVYIPSLTEALALLTYMQDATLVHPNHRQLGTLRTDFDPVREDDILPTSNLLTYGHGAKDFSPKSKDVYSEEYFDILEEGLEAKDFINGNTKSLGHPILAEVILLGSDTISNKGLNKKEDQDEYNRVKGKLNWITPGIFNKGDRLQTTNCQGSHLIGIDLDDTDITDAEISKIFGQWEYLQYTTFSHQDWSDKRRIRIIAPYDRVVSLEEHTRICEYFVKRIEEVINPKGTRYENRRNSGLDLPKMKAYVKLFCPHKESDVKWIRRKNNRKTVSVEVDYILAKTPKLPKVKIPTESDIIWKYVAKSVKIEEKVVENKVSDKPKSKLDLIREYISDGNIDERETKVYKTCVDLINSMMPHNRSNIAMKVAGIIGKSIHDHAIKMELYDMMVSQGIDDSAKTQAKKYAGISGGVSTSRSYRPKEQKQTHTKPVVTYKPKQIETVVHEPVTKEVIKEEKQVSKKFKELMNMNLDL